MIETSLLEQLVAFCDYQTLSAAAEHLLTSQPALSRSMRKLEEDFGVPLFVRSKNRLQLNENGLLAAECARQLLDGQEAMVARVRALDRSRRTIAVGSVAPGPLMDLSPMLSSEYEDRTVSTELRKEGELVPMLKQGIFQLVILREIPADDEIYACPCGSEHLYVSLPESHPLASRKSVTFAEMDGTEFLQISNVGVWQDIKKAEMPHARIYLQRDNSAINAIAAVSSMATFKTDISFRHNAPEAGRVAIPFSDESAVMRFWCCCLKKDERKYRSWFRTLEAKYGVRDRDAAGTAAGGPGRA